MPPGILFVLGSFFVTESPRWLFAARQKEKGLAALLRSRTPEQATIELQEMEERASNRQPPRQQIGSAKKFKDSLLRRKYVIPFLLACVILACNTATGINSVIGLQHQHPHPERTLRSPGALGIRPAHRVNFCFTAIGMMLVDRKGRKFLFILGTSGIIVSMIVVATLFHADRKAEHRLPRSVPGPGRPGPDTDASTSIAPRPSVSSPRKGYHGSAIDRSDRASFAIIYSYGDFTGTTSYRPLRRSGRRSAPDHARRARARQQGPGTFQNPFGNSKPPPPRR